MSSAGDKRNIVRIWSVEKRQQLKEATMTEPKPDTKKEEQHSSKQGGDPAKTVLPEGMIYPTPELNPETGAPIDPRFQSQGGASQEATASKPSPKSEAATPQNGEEDDEDEDDDKKAGKGKEKPRGKR
jgi:hypothetical protein